MNNFDGSELQFILVQRSLFIGKNCNRCKKIVDGSNLDKSCLLCTKQCKLLAINAANARIDSATTKHQHFALLAIYTIDDKPLFEQELASKKSKRIVNSNLWRRLNFAQLNGVRRKQIQIQAIVDVKC